MDGKITFRVVPHSTRPQTQIVEVICDGVVCAAIYPGKDKTIKLVSAHFAGEADRAQMPGSIRMDLSGMYPPIPALLITFDPRPYKVGTEGIVRES